MVTVILPTFNRASLVIDSINSVLTQDYHDLELFVMDDGSTDDTAALVKTIGDPRIRYYALPHSGHTGRMKNLAIRESTGDYIAFIDSDDLWKPGKLKQQIDALSRFAAAGFSISDVTTFRGDDILIDHSYQHQNTTICDNIFSLLKSNRMLLYNPTLVIRRGCLGKTGLFDEEMLSGDYHFNMRLAFHFDAVVLYETLVLRRVHESNLSEQIPFENYREYISTFDFLLNSRMISRKDWRKARSLAFYKIGKLHQATRATGEAIAKFLKSIWYNPIQKESYWNLAKTVVRPKKRSK